MSSMKEALRKRFDWMPADARERAIDEALDSLRSPTPLMCAEGARVIRESDEGMFSSEALAEQVFGAMCVRASEGG